MGKKSFISFVASGVLLLGINSNRITSYNVCYTKLLRNKIYGYEALSTFDIDTDLITTEEIFNRLHHTNELFFDLEKRNKVDQVENYDFDEKLFLNFDADIVSSQVQKEYWSEFLKKYKDFVVVEITENGSDDESSSEVMRDFSTWLKQNGINSALDDFAKEGSMFSFFIMENSQYIKIDKSFLNRITSYNVCYTKLLRKTCYPLWQNHPTQN